MNSGIMDAWQNSQVRALALLRAEQAEGTNSSHCAAGVCFCTCQLRHQEMQIRRSQNGFPSRLGAGSPGQGPQHSQSTRAAGDLADKLGNGRRWPGLSA